MVKLRSKPIRLSFNMKTNLLFAIGRKDTTGKIIGKPVLKKEARNLKQMSLHIISKPEKL